MSRSKHFSWTLASVLCSNMLLGAIPSHAHLETLALESNAVSAEPSMKVWQTFSSDTDRFQVLMPSQPIQYSLSNRHIQAQMFMQMRLTGPQRLELYGVGVAQLPRLFTDPQDVKQMMAACAKFLADGDQVTNVQRIPIGNHIGVEVEATSANGRLHVTRCYLVGQRIYMLFTASEPLKQIAVFESTTSRTKGIERTQSMEKFLNSFQLFDSI
ncbi:hypothetical protein [Acaryochloris sp. IP29b_bin.137]|uniref:hypothetical protein n=1 Tax=Acaryochloris sp. IP29b_bin.137 TaxID=2969217 RepID=UPI00261CD700|nr:hypothetical protein [Acaryochloris sp. IP29b_bin.137]